MRMPRKRRQILTIVGGTLFAANVLALVFSIHYVVGTSLPTSQAQYAGAKLATVVPPQDPKPETDECKLGEVHTIKGTVKERTTSICYTPPGTTTQGPDAMRSPACQHSDPKRCVVQYCPPGDVFRSGNAEGCIFISCSGDGTQCLKEFLPRLAQKGASSVVLDELKKQPQTGLVNLDGREAGQLASTLNPEQVKKWQAETSADDTRTKELLEKIAGVADTPGKCLQSNGACTAVFPPVNKEIKEQQARLAPPGPGSQPGTERPTMRLPGGAGLPPPPLRPPQMPPQMMPPQTPTQTFPCTNVPRPSATCERGEWDEQRGPQGCVIGWLCTASSTSVGTPPDPHIILIANPASVMSGQKTRLGWVTTGMKSCIISSDDLPEFTEEHADNPNKNGSLLTPPLTSTTEFKLECTTLADEKQSKTVTVGVKAADAREGQLASALLASAQTNASSPEPETSACNPGEVHTVTHSKEGPPSRTAAKCFIGTTGGTIVPVQTSDRQACKWMPSERSKECIVRYCPPPNMFAQNKSGSCLEINCAGKNKTECSDQLFQKAKQSNGPTTILAENYKTPILTPNGDAAWLNSALTPQARTQVASEIRKQVSTYDELELIAVGRFEKGEAHCMDCKPELQLNKNIVTTPARIPVKAPPGPGTQGPGPGTVGPGPAQPPANTGFQFPNIHKDPSGTDVLAWMRHLLGGNQDQNKQTPPPGNNAPSCTNLPQPSASQCSDGTWESSSSGGCMSAWKCVRTRIVSFKAVPDRTTAGNTVNLAWVSEGMKECIVSSPDLPAFTEANKDKKNVSGGVTSPILTGTTRFQLNCIGNDNSKPSKDLSVGVLP